MAKAKRGEPLARPTAPDEWQLLPLDTAAAKGWSDLCRYAPGPTADIFDRLTADPREITNPARQHRLRGSLGRATIKGIELEQWEYEATKGGRVRYCPDDATRIVWVVWAGTGHPKDTE